MVVFSVFLGRNLGVLLAWLGFSTTFLELFCYREAYPSFSLKYVLLPYFLLLIIPSEVSFFLIIKALTLRRRIVFTRRPDIYKSYVLTIGSRLSLTESTALTVTSKPS